MWSRLTLERRGVFRVVDGDRWLFFQLRGRRDKRKGRKVVQCHGVFDLLHIGHIRHFEQARRMGDVLVVTITPDRYVDKGPHRPAFFSQVTQEIPWWLEERAVFHQASK